jgi:hypothetical protein
MADQLLFPRPEYPRPDRQRGTVEGYDWLNLNGPWQFRFDGDRKGVEQQWFLPDSLEWREQIIVPFCWESLAAWGEGEAAGNDNYYATRVFRNPLEVTRSNHRSALRYEVGWYRRTIPIPDNDAWKGKRIILHIGAADFFTDCWVNGIHLGHHEGGYTPFEFDLTEVLQKTANPRLASIVLRVEDPMDNAEQPVGKQWRWYTTTSGIWQTVYLEPRHDTHIKSFQIVSDIDTKTVCFTIHCANARQPCRIEMHISTPDSGSETVTVEVENGVAQKTVKMDPALLWEPNSPNLYPVKMELLAPEGVCDVVRTYFGMRKIDFELAKESGVPTALRINGVARYLRGALHQSYYPEGVYTAGSVETLKTDIECAKRFGFNFLRIHIKVDDPLLLYWADKLGMLLMADFPNFGEGGDTTLARKRFETMMRETVERDFNHPAIFAWCLFNETWGFGGQDTFAEILHGPPTSASRKEAAARTEKLSPQKWVQQMWELGKKLDPTRMVEDMSVCHWEHLEYYLHCDTDINSWHFYISDYAKAKEHIDKVVRSTFVGSSFNYVPGFLHKGQPLINSEYGGIGALDGDRDVSWSFKFLTNELRRHQQIAAYIYTELHDVEWEFNGFLNYDRTAKEFGYDPKIINESNALPIDSPPVQQVQPGAVVKLDVASSHYSTRRYDEVFLHWELGGIDGRGRMQQDLARGRVPIAFPHRKVAAAHTIELRMPEETMLCTLLLSARTEEGQTVARNYVQYFVSAQYPADLEQSERSVVLRTKPGAWTEGEWRDGIGDRAAALSSDSCHGFGHGFFEWSLPLSGVDLRKARRLKVLCEASSHRADAPQTDDELHSTMLQIFLNNVRVYEGVLRNHPHDSRGVLSYLRGDSGAYGYLVHAFAENETIGRIADGIENDALRFRCCVPAEALARGGLTVYGAQCGRFPISPTVIIDW